jgi:hypothetical protein
MSSLVLPSSAKWWSALLDYSTRNNLAFEDGFFLQTSKLFSALLSCRLPHFLSGIAAEGDPAIVGLPARLHNEISVASSARAGHRGFGFKGDAIGGLMINGAAVAFFSDPRDDYRSYMEFCWVEPGLTFRTKFTPVQVHAKVATHASFDREVTASDSLIVLASKFTKDALVTFGTAFHDESYPCIYFSSNSPEIHRAAQLAEKDMLDKIVPAGAPTSPPRL